MNSSVEYSQGGARSTHEILKAQLDDFASGACDIDDLRDALLEICAKTDDAGWEALALLDQYQRRSVLEPQTAKNLKDQVQHAVFEKRRVDTAPTSVSDRSARRNVDK